MSAEGRVLKLKCEGRIGLTDDKCMKSVTVDWMGFIYI